MLRKFQNKIQICNFRHERINELRSFKGIFKAGGNKAIVEVVVILLLSVALAIGAVFFKYSVQSVDGILLQAHRIKARNLAYAAYQKALLTIKNQYVAGNLSWAYPEQKLGNENEFERKLGEGAYKVLKVETVKNLKTPIETISKNYQNVKYVIGSADYGNYDVYRITTMGEIPASNTRVKMTSLVKIIREKVRY